MSQIHDRASFLSATAGSDLLSLIGRSSEKSTILHRTHCKYFEEMRILDGTYAMHHERAVGSVKLTSRARGVDASTPLVSYFFRGGQYQI